MMGRVKAGSRGGTRAALVVLALMFAATFLIFILTNMLRLGPRLAVIEMAVPMILGDALICLPYVWLVPAAVRMGWRRTWWIMLIVGLVGAAAQTLWDTLLRIETGIALPGPWGNALVASLPLNIYHTGLLMALLGFQAAYLRATEQDVALSAARRGEQQALLVSLRLQLNPHFLFNSLNAISSLVVTGRNRDAETMIERLCGFLRHILSADPEGPVRLGEEFDLIDSYLAIEQVRFGEKLVIDMVLPADLTKLTVPPYLLQPLVENAMKYAVAPARRPVTVTIAAARDGDRLLLSVRDDGEGDPAPGGTGLGLANVRQRLAVQYGDRAGLTVTPGPDGFVAEVCIPL